MGGFSKSCAGEPQIRGALRASAAPLGPVRRLLHDPPAMSRTATISAGLLVFRRRAELEVLLAHPGGPFWAKKDEGAWSIPKGLTESGADVLATARREFDEETNISLAGISGPFDPLAPVKQKSGKIVHAFAFEADLDLSSFASNTFEIEWPPKSGQRRIFPEVDRVAYFALTAAKIKILGYQLPLLNELEQLVG
jgi:predicted NUDIX family NTP pyrophosphohydrolase